MRTSHVQIKKKLASEISLISEEVFFSSQQFADYLADIAEAASKRYKCPVQIILFFAPADPTVAYTNNRQITINGANILTTQFTTLTRKADSLVGLLAHELGHILYTDFDRSHDYFQALSQGKLEPLATVGLSHKESQAKMQLQKYASENDPLAMKFILRIAHTLLNILEDAYVEKRLVKQFPGRFAFAIDLNNQAMHQQSLSLKAQLDEGFPPLIILQNLLLSYCLSGQVEDPEGIFGDIWTDFLSLKAIVDTAQKEEIEQHGDIQVRLKATSLLLLDLWSYIQDGLDQLAKQRVANGQQAENAAKEPNSSGSKSRRSKQDHTPSHDPDQNGSAQDEKDEDALIDALLNGLVQFSQEPIGDGNGISEETEQEQANDKSTRSPSALNETLDTTSQQDNSSQTSQKDESNDEPASEDILGHRSSTGEINALLTDIAIERRNKENLDRSKELAMRLDYGSLHQNVQVCIHRLMTIPDDFIQDYHDLEPKINHLARQMMRQITAALPKDNGGIKAGYMGKRFVPRTLIHNDGRYFQTKTLPQNPTKLAIALVVDESGSMKGERITAARLTSLIMHQCCQMMEIPLLIIGHTASYKAPHVTLYNYTDFDSYDNQDKYRLMSMTARQNNRDGVAIRFAAEKLLMRPEKKLLIILSDGMPSAYQYHGEDIVDLVSEYTHKGITIFAGAIGSDKEAIESFYQDGYLDMSNLNELPSAIAKLISQQLKF